MAYLATLARLFLCLAYTSYEYIAICQIRNFFVYTLSAPLSLAVLFVLVAMVRKVVMLLLMADCVKKRPNTFLVRRESIFLGMMEQNERREKARIVNRCCSNPIAPGCIEENRQKLVPLSHWA